MILDATPTVKQNPAVIGPVQEGEAPAEPSMGLCANCW